MKKVFLLLCLMGCISAHANKVDSLRGVWNDAGMPDTVRMLAFRQIIWKGYLFSDPDSAGILGDSLYRSAMRKDLKDYAADALIIRGIIFMITGKFDSAVVKLDRQQRRRCRSGEHVRQCVLEEGRPLACYRHVYEFPAQNGETGQEGWCGNGGIEYRFDLQ